MFQTNPEQQLRSSSISGKGTVAYGANATSNAEAPDTLKGPPADFAEATTVERGGGVALEKDEKRTTFSHATGEANLASSWKQLHGKQRWVVSGGIGVLMLTIVLVAFRSQRHAPVGETRINASATRPVFAPIPVQNAPFVGPPPPAVSPDVTVPRTEIRPGTVPRARRAKAQLEGTLPNPFEEVPSAKRTRSPASDDARRSTPAPEPADQRAPAPARPKRQIIKEL